MTAARGYSDDRAVRARASCGDRGLRRAGVSRGGRRRWRSRPFGQRAGLRSLPPGELVRGLLAGRRAPSVLLLVGAPWRGRAGRGCLARADLWRLWFLSTQRPHLVGDLASLAG